MEVLGEEGGEKMGKK